MLCCLFRGRHCDHSSANAQSTSIVRSAENGDAGRGSLCLRTDAEWVSDHWIQCAILIFVRSRISNLFLASYRLLIQNRCRIDLHLLRFSSWHHLILYNRVLPISTTQSAHFTPQNSPSICEATSCFGYWPIPRPDHSHHPSLRAICCASCTSWMDWYMANHFVDYPRTLPTNNEFVGIILYQAV
jgi:hypothetical protein